MSTEPTIRKRRTFIKKICIADVVEHWGPSLVAPHGYNYATCNSSGAINWDTTRLMKSEEALEKGYILLP